MPLEPRGVLVLANHGNSALRQIGATTLWLDDENLQPQPQATLRCYHSSRVHTQRCLFVAGSVFRPPMLRL